MGSIYLKDNDEALQLNNLTNFDSYKINPKTHLILLVDSNKHTAHYTTLTYKSLNVVVSKDSVGGPEDDINMNVKLSQCTNIISMLVEVRLHSLLTPAQDEGD